jgi:hypothetical protein
LISDEPPKLRSVELLRHLLAWRIQAARLGGLDRETRQYLIRRLLALRERRSTSPAA